MQDEVKKVPMLDEHGEPMLNADGTPMMVEEKVEAAPVVDPTADPAAM